MPRRATSSSPLGGDGTTLAALHAAAPHRLPVLGIACGSLGALTATSADATEEALTRFAAGDWHRRVLPGVGVAADGSEPHHAINDLVVVRKGANQVVIGVHVDGELYVRFAGDGVVLSTPLGSSAYTMAAGGPMLAAGTEAIVVTPVAAHGGSTPPLVVGATSTVTIEIEGGFGGARIEFDGQIKDELEPHVLTTSWCADYATLVRFDGAESAFAGLRRRQDLDGQPAGVGAGGAGGGDGAARGRQPEADARDRRATESTAPTARSPSPRSPSSRSSAPSGSRRPAPGTARTAPAPPATRPADIPANRPVDRPRTPAVPTAPRAARPAPGRTSPIGTRAPASPFTAASPLSEFMASTPSAFVLRTAFAITCGAAGDWSSTRTTRDRPPTARIARASPRQRASSPWFGICRFTHNARRTPARASRCPALKPAGPSGWPTCASTPSLAYTSLPELMVTVGIPALTARRIAGASPGSGSETTSPSGLAAIAWSMSATM